MDCLRDISVQGDLHDARHIQYQHRVADLVEVGSELAIVVVVDAAADWQPTEEESLNIAEEYDVTVLKITAQIDQLDHP